LNKREEDSILHHLNHLQETGLQVTAKHLMEVAKKMAKEKHIRSKFPFSTFSRWYRNFRKRNPIIVFKRPEKIDPKRLDIGIDVIQNFFENVRRIMDENKISPERILNADETGIPISPGLTKTLGIKGKATKIRGIENHEQVTMMILISASGETYSPLFIYRGKTVLLKNETDLPNGVMISTSPKGFINSTIFDQWIEVVIKEAKITKDNPALMILDGHASRACIDAVETAKNSGLHIITLPGGSTHLLQPQDKSIFRVFKEKYRAKIHELIPVEAALYKKEYEKLEIIKAAAVVAKDVLEPNRIKESFSVTGLHPYNPQIVIGKIEKKEERKELSDQQLKDLLAPTIIFQKKEKAIGKKRFSISNKVITSNEVIEELKKKRKAEEEKSAIAKKKQRMKKKA
jgi:hypothetical protein